MKYFIFTARTDDKTNAACADIRRIMSSEKFTDSVSDCGVIIVVGGDGTLLRCVTGAGADKPCFCVNTGRVGFLSGAECDEAALTRELGRLVRGECRVSERLMLEVVHGGDVYYAVNDAVFSRPRERGRSRLPRFKVTRDSKTISDVRADGVIISTPTGSTAYSLSAGGAVIEPELDCMQYTPICPHSFGAPPVILTGSREICVSYTELTEERAYFSIDGGSPVVFEPDTEVGVKAAARRLRLLTGSDCFFNALSSKLFLVPE